MPRWPARCASWTIPRWSSSDSVRSEHSRESVRRRGNPRTSLRPHVVAAPIAPELVQERERLERLNPIEEEHTVQMIRFMRDDPRGEAGGRHFNFSPGPIERTEQNLSCTRNAAANVGNAQAAFPVVDDLP